MTTSARLLALLGLLQSRPGWTGPELATRLEVTERTIRNDIERLRALDYPVHAELGRAGGYRLGDSGRLPPLLLSDAEAVAVAVGLTAAGASEALAEPTATAIAKLERILPARLRTRAQSLRESTDVGPANTGTNVADPPVDPELLAELAVAVRRREGLRFWYHDDEGVEADPYRLVSWQQRWYLVARRRPTGDWQAFRADWLRLRVPGGGRFTAQPLVGGDYASFVLRDVASTGWAVHARIAVDAPAAEVLGRINATVGVVETVDDAHSVLVTGGDSLEIVAVWIGMLGLPFHVDRPPELVDHVRQLAARYADALPADRT
jgi:predicted DNA-binding transcriptional regulator YafY